MKTISHYETTYSVREWHELSYSERNEAANLLRKISEVNGQRVGEPIIFFLKILLPDLTVAELSSDDKTCAMLFQKISQELLNDLPEGMADTSRLMRTTNSKKPSLT